MSDRDGYDPHRPWHVIMHRNGQATLVDTYDTATEVVAALTQVVAPERVNVLHVPTGRDGTGAQFLDMVNRVCTFTPSETRNG